MLNGRIEKYTNYSVAKAVFQIALKKSSYLILLPKNGGRLRYQFIQSKKIKCVFVSLIPLKVFVSFFSIR